MHVIFVGAGPGDPDLLTVRAARILQSCRCCIYAGSLISPQVLALLPATAAKYDSAGMTLQQIIEICKVAQARETDVVRLHSGDPSIYGAIREQMRELDALGIAYRVVPGVSAFQAAAAALRAELTAPEISQTIILSRVAGRTPVPAAQELGRLARTQATLCLYLSIQEIGALTHTLAAEYGSDCPAAAIYRVSWPEERIIRGTLGTLAAQVEAAGIGRTAVIVVGRALAGAGPASRLYDAGFSHGYRHADE
jgi:precorrin-4/cobalt-precorrin-4 C11-methyltransferase